MVFSKFGCLRNALHGFSRFHPCRLLVYLPFRRYTICVVFQYVNLIPIDAFTTAVYVGLTKPPFCVPGRRTCIHTLTCFAFHLCVTKNVISVLLKNILQHFLKKHRFVFMEDKKKSAFIINVTLFGSNWANVFILSITLKKVKVHVFVFFMRCPYYVLSTNLNIFTCKMVFL